MRHRFPAMLALLVVVATAVTGAPALTVTAEPTATTAVQPTNGSTAPPIVQQSTPLVTVHNTSNYLALPASEVETSQYGRAALDVTGAVAIESAQLRGQLLEASIFRRFENAESSRQRTALLRQAADEIEARTASLRSLQIRTLREYNRGAISTSLFLRRLAVIDARARRLTVTADRILREVNRSPTYSLPNPLRTRFQNLRSRPVLLRGPNRARIASAITGAQPPARIYVEASGTGIVIARVTGNTYTREAFLSSQYVVGGPDRFGQGNQVPISAAYERARELYPWTIDHDISAPSATGFGNTSVYRITIDHTQGTLISYLDGTTREVFREIQEKRLSALPTERTTNATDQLRLVVNRTHDSGPMAITVREFNSTRTVDARVAINGQPVGTTGPDGRLWTIEPSGRVTVTAVAPSGNRVTLTIPALA